MNKFKIIGIFIFFILVILIFSKCSLIKSLNKPEPKVKEPVVYLYPTVKQRITVKLNFNGKIIYSYPKYNEGWKVIANPNGNIVNLKDEREYKYLIWEGEPETTSWNLSKGYVVNGKDTKKFLLNKLNQLGLNTSECNEFVAYWLPYMENNKYNLITFQNKEYEKIAKLNVSPKPDSMLRIFMVFKAIKSPIHIEQPNTKPFVRKGFTVVEWGGSEIK